MPPSDFGYVTVSPRERLNQTGAIYGMPSLDKKSPRSKNTHSALVAQKRFSLKDGTSSGGMNVTARSTQPSWNTQMRAPKSREGQRVKRSVSALNIMFITH